MNLYMDTETTGVYNTRELHWRTDYDKLPYPVTIAWRFKNKSHYYILHQEGREVPKEATKVHGITTKMANAKELEGNWKWIYEELITDGLHAANIIGHNIFFDVSIVKADILRKYGPESEQAELIMEALHKDKRIDTMRGSIGLCRRWPKLEELYELLFKSTFKAHNALEDVLATEKCFIELRKRKVL